MGDYTVARSRLKRAISHHTHLGELWNAVPSGRLCKPKARVGPNGYGALIATEVGEIPDELPLLLGEMLYQLRSALDACIYQGAIHATKKDPPDGEGKLEFPITADPNEWPALKKRRLFALPVSIQDGIEKIQPYNNQFLPPGELIISLNRNLGMLHDWARKDRHRKLHIIGSWPIHLKPEFILPDGAILDWVDIMPPATFTDGAVIAKFHISGFGPNANAMVNPMLRTTLGCNEAPVPCDPSDTLERRLNEMVNSVGGVIDFFERNL